MNRTEWLLTRMLLADKRDGVPDEALDEWRFCGWEQHLIDEFAKKGWGRFARAVSDLPIGHVRMEGNRVFKHAVANISSAIQAVLDETGLTADDIDWFVPHQANKRILDGVAKKMGIAEEKVVITVDEHANTSAASIPLALNHAVRSGRAKPGDLILSEAMGGGFSWGASLFRL